MSDARVTERDIEVARQMGAPEETVAALEAGSWVRASDREMVRYAELAIDHMRDAHGVECEARWGNVPWVLEREASVELEVASGEHAGKTVAVGVSAKEPREYTDDWWRALHGKECEDLLAKAASEALSPVLVEGSWAASGALDATTAVYAIPDGQGADEAASLLRGSLAVYVSAPLAAQSWDEAAVEGRLRETLASLGWQKASYLVLCVSEAPEDGVVTPEWGREVWDRSYGDLSLRVARFSGVVGGAA